MKHLEGDDLAGVGVKDAVDGALAARGDLVEDLVAPYFLLLHGNSPQVQSVPRVTARIPPTSCGIGG